MNILIIDNYDSFTYNLVHMVEKITGNRSEPTAATYGTDCSVLQPKVGITNVICGPGSIEQAHQPNEFITLNQMVPAVKIYLDIARYFSK